MGNRQSQVVRNFINNNVNTTAIASVISNYATRTNAVTTNTQDLCVRITTTDGGIDFGERGFTASQEIQSMIDVQSMVDRADKDQLVNDLQRTISSELRGALERTTGGFDLFEAGANQELQNQLINNLDTYVNQTINMSTLDEVLLSASNVQRGCYEFSAAYVRGPLVITQSIQSNIMANNLVQQVVDRAIENREVQDIISRTEGDVISENRGEIPGIGNLFGGFSTWIFYIVAALLVIGSLVLAFFIPGSIRTKVIIAAIGIVIGIAVAVVGFIRSRASTRRVGKAKRL